MDISVVARGSEGDMRPFVALGRELRRRAGRRGILLTAWGGMSGNEAGDDILTIDRAPHDWLFPRVAAVVHHGGAGPAPIARRSLRKRCPVPYLIRVWRHPPLTSAPAFAGRTVSGRRLTLSNRHAKAPAYEPHRPPATPTAA